MSLKDTLPLLRGRVGPTLCLNCFLLCQLHLVGTSATAAGEWLPENDRIEVNLSGTFKDVEGNSVDLEDFRNDVLMLNFWATWCGPCLIEMPSMASLSEEFSGKGLRIVAVSDEDEATISRFVDQNPYPFTFLIDREGRLSQKLKVWALPLTIILDRNGKLTYFHQGAQLWDTPEMKRRLGKLVKE
jgi:peroxiredoxin